MNVKGIYEIFHMLNCGCEINYAMMLAVIYAVYAGALKS